MAKASAKKDSMQVALKEGRAWEVYTRSLARRNGGDWVISAIREKKEIELFGEKVAALPPRAGIIVAGTEEQGRLFVSHYRLNLERRGDEEIKFLKRKLVECFGVPKEMGRAIKTGDLVKAVGDPEQVVQEWGGGAVEVARWKEAILENKVRRILRSAGVSKEAVASLTEEWVAGPADLWETLKKLPWKLSLEIERVGFLSMDLVGETFGLPKDSPERIGAGLAYVLEKMGEENGGTIQGANQALTKAAEMLRIDKEMVLKKAEEVHAVEEVEPGWLGEAQIVGAEREVAALIHVFRASKGGWGPKPEVFRKQGEKVGLVEEQQEALSVLSSSRIGVLCGGPGTGKTTIVGTIVQGMEQEGHKVLLMAPTGKAARRLGQATERTTYTIHKALFGMKREEQAPGALWVIDEASMIPSRLMRWLLQMAATKDVAVLLVGDPDQLPPIEAGVPFLDMIRAETVPSARLLKIHRQGEGSGIPLAAAEIREGRGLLEGENFQGVQVKKFATLLELEAAMVTKGLELRERFGEEEGVALSSVNQGIASVAGIGKAVQEKVTGWGSAEIRGSGYRWLVGDPVMHLHNDYNAEGGPLYHGAVGKILEVNAGISDGEGDVLIEWDDGISRRHDVDEGIIADVILAYALTIHRSQGSEWEGVVIGLPKRGRFVAGREAVYTAITRARKECVLYVEGNALEEAVKRVVAKRETALSRFLS